jgi:hypothetical protein
MCRTASLGFRENVACRIEVGKLKVIGVLGVLILQQSSEREKAVVLRLRQALTRKLPHPHNRSKPDRAGHQL